MSLTFEVNKQDLSEALALLQRTGANMQNAVPRIISDVTTEAYREARRIIDSENIKRTGLYSKSVRMEVTGTGETMVGIVGDAAKDARSGFPYPVVIEEGSGLYGPKHAKYPITPTTKKALAFFAKSGEHVIVQKVMHPGVKPRHVFRRARDYAVKQIDKLVKEFLTRMGKI